MRKDTREALRAEYARVMRDMYSLRPRGVSRTDYVKGFHAACREICEREGWRLVPSHLVDAAKRVRYLCDKCEGTGEFHAESGAVAPCYACQGEGTQDHADVMRNRSYWRHKAQRETARRVCPQCGANPCYAICPTQDQYGGDQRAENDDYEFGARYDVDRERFDDGDA